MDREGVVFGIYNFKGGAAKSTTAVNIAGAMAMQGKKILMLDFDQQCNLTQFFNTTDWMKVDTSALEKAAHCSQQASKLRSQTRHEPPEPPFGAWEDKLADVTEPTDIKAFVNMIDRQKNVNSLFEPVFHECDWRRALKILEHDENGPNPDSGIHRVNEDAFRGNDVVVRADGGSSSAEGYNGKTSAPGGELWIMPGSEQLVEHESEMGRRLQA